MINPQRLDSRHDQALYRYLKYERAMNRGSKKKQKEACHRARKALRRFHYLCDLYWSLTH